MWFINFLVRNNGYFRSNMYFGIIKRYPERTPHFIETVNHREPFAKKGRRARIFNRIGKGRQQVVAGWKRIIEVQAAIKQSVIRL